MYWARFALTGCIAFSTSSETITVQDVMTSKLARPLPPPAFAKPFSSEGFRSSAYRSGSYIIGMTPSAISAATSRPFGLIDAM
jgi:hypothetical protein